ncbi:hypothetical protein BGX38DRAFT_852300 [Terfezia claveryi]|nr:hypothetical protein BGX38DRAFT_852300 [Terfezia claveryi]
MATQAIQQKIVTKVGVVVAAHMCAQTVKVRVAKTVKDKHIRKYLTQHDEFLAHDERTVCVPGDIVELHRGRASSTKRHIVTKIISAQSTPHKRRAPETYPEYLARRDAEFRAAQIRRLQGPNCEKYFKKYEKIIPDAVKMYREAWEAKKKEEEEQKRMEREKVEREEREERERKKKKEARNEARNEARRVMAEQKAKEESQKEAVTAP